MKICFKIIILFLIIFTFAESIGTTLSSLSMAMISIKSFDSVQGEEKEGESEKESEKENEENLKSKTTPHFYNDYLFNQLNLISMLIEPEDASAIPAFPSAQKNTPPPKVIS